MTIAAVETRSRDALGRVLDLVLRDGEPLVIVPSPPGAGKTSLVEAVAVAAVHHGLRVLVVSPRAEQTYDFIRRLLTDYRPLPVEALMASKRKLPDDLQVANIPDPRKAEELNGGTGVVVGTVDKLVDSAPDIGPTAFDLVIVDEAWQVTYGNALVLFALADQVLAVGDAGQLPPLVRSETHRFEAREHHVHWPAPDELMRRHPSAPVVPLPATRRLPQDTVDFIQPAFYPSLPFVSAADPSERRLEASAEGMGAGIDRAIDLLIGGASLAGVLLPARAYAGIEFDPEVAELSAAVARRLLERGVRWEGERLLAAEDIGCVDPHRDSGTATRRALSALDVGPELVVTTPEIWQGLQRPVMIARYPVLPGRRLSSFDLEPGRVCVQLSRHQVACIIVGRDGVGDALEAHQHDVSARASEAVDAEFVGWRAHSTLWQRLDSAERFVRL